MILIIMTKNTWCLLVTIWCKIEINLVLNQKKSKKYLVQNQNNFVQASKDLVSFWCRNKINLVQNQIQLPKSFGAEKNCFGAGKKPSWCEKKIILVQKREKQAGPVWCRKKIFWCRNRSLPFPYHLDHFYVIIYLVTFALVSFLINFMRT